MLSSEQVIPRYFTLLPTLRCLLYKPCGRPSSPHPSVLTVGNKQPRSPLLSLSPSRPHRPTNATPSMLFALARPSLPPPDCFLFRALCLVLCFRESPRGNDKQMSAALSLQRLRSRRHGDGKRPIGIFNSTPRGGRTPSSSAKGFRIFLLLRRRKCLQRN